MAVKDGAAEGIRHSRLEAMTPSAIRAVHNLAMELRSADPGMDFLPMHFGESDAGTPEFIVEAGVRALREGAHFYENNSGRPDLTAALAQAWSTRLGMEVPPGAFVVTSGGVQAIHLSLQGLLSPGDHIINITPSWPNFREAAIMAGATVHDCPLVFSAEESAFHLDLSAMETLADSLPALRMVIVNSPSNPTGNVLDEEEMLALLAFCDRRGAVLMADEMYDRIQFTGKPLPSFWQLRRTGQPLVVINGFSKTYAMTGWRLGYLLTDPGLAGQLAAMQEFVTSCAPAAAQVAARTALLEGESYVAESLARYQALRDLTVTRLEGIPGARVARPQGSFYAFFQLPGSGDSLAYCQKLLRETGVALAPGVAFGVGGEGWLRLCFAKSTGVLEKALSKIDAFVAEFGQ